MKKINLTLIKDKPQGNYIVASVSSFLRILNLNRMKNKLSITTIALIMTFSVATAQVTIGSGQPPRTGSLLDIEQDGLTQKGMGLPRVALKSLTVLTIAPESQNADYVGTMVYNTTDNSTIRKGIYCWMGNTWKQAIVVNSKGEDGSMLKSNGNGTYGWSTVDIPEYEFHKPTNIHGFKEKNAQINEYQYDDIVYGNEIRPGAWNPDPDAFKNKYVYTDTLNVQTDAATIKFMLLGMTITTQKSSLSDALPSENTWEAIITEVFMTKINPNGSLGTTKSIKKYRKTANIFRHGPLTSYFDLFSIISLNDVDPTISKGDYQIKIQVKVAESSLGRDPNFKVPDIFYRIGLADINLVLFEHQ